MLDMSVSGYVCVDIFAKFSQCAKIHQGFPHFVARTESFDGKIAHCGIIRFSPLKLLHHKFPKKLQLAKIFEHAKSP